MIKVAVAGCAGRMGRALVQAIASSKDLRLTAATVSSQGEIDIDVGMLAQIKPLGLFPTYHLVEEKSDFDVLIDFTRSEVTLSNVDWCVKHHKKMVIGTTGLDASQRQLITQAAKAIPIVLAPNMSVGLNVCLKLVEEAAKAIGKEADLHIIDVHHRHKKDSPSGTSLQIEAALRKIVADKPIEHASIRSGELVGDHTVLFGLEGETIEIKHHAVNREIFVKGALRAARWLQNKPAGLYSMADVLT